MLNLLFSPTTGAGLTILRNIIPSDTNHTIEPTAPASSTGTPQYIAIGPDWGQIWLAQQAQSYGVQQIYADAWGAPAYMKANVLISTEVHSVVLRALPLAASVTGVRRTRTIWCNISRTIKALASLWLMLDMSMNLTWLLAIPAWSCLQLKQRILRKFLVPL
jgi:hypothetical protein